MIRAWAHRIRARGWSPTVVLAYAALLGVFLWTLGQFYIPGKGFSYFIAFGSNQEMQRLSKVRRLDYYVEKASDGYDAQYYVQIAMDPSLQNRELRQAVDSLPYRARRILFPALAHVFGLGRPEWILQAYALLNPVAWLLLAGLLLHWFPPRDWGDFVRWAGVLFSFGMCVSVRNALVDGPALLLLTTGVWLVARNRPWLSVVALAAGGLGKETGLLGAAALLPGQPRDRRGWGGAIFRGVVVAAPLALWLLYLTRLRGPTVDAGYRNFDWPFAAYGRKWQEAFAGLPEMTWPDFGTFWSLLMLVALTVQFLVLVLRPRWQETWWRVGASYALLMIFLGDAVWEGYPGASSRVLLPMQVAFNVLVPAGRGWMTVLILGNLTFFSTPGALHVPAGEGYWLKGPRELLDGSGGSVVAVDFDDAWYGTENGRGSFWRWVDGPGTITLGNPHARPLQFRLRFGLTAVNERIVRVILNGTTLWSGEVSARNTVELTLSDLVMLPGGNRLEFGTDRPGATVENDPRTLAFCVHDLRFDVRAMLPADAP